MTPRRAPLVIVVKIPGLIGRRPPVARGMVNVVRSVLVKCVANLVRLCFLLRNPFRLLMTLRPTCKRSLIRREVLVYVLLSICVLATCSNLWFSVRGSEFLVKATCRSVVPIKLGIGIKPPCSVPGKPCISVMYPVLTIFGISYLRCLGGSTGNNGVGICRAMLLCGRPGLKRQSSVNLRLLTRSALGQRNVAILSVLWVSMLLLCTTSSRGLPRSPI